MKTLIFQFSKLFGYLHIVTRKFEAYFNEVLKDKKLKVSVKSFSSCQVPYIIH